MQHQPKPAEPIKVEAYSGHTHPQRPTSFIWRGRRYQVEEVTAEWRERTRKHFLVRTAEDEVYEVCYDEPNDHWLLLGRRAMG